MLHGRMSKRVNRNKRRRLKMNRRMSKKKARSRRMRTVMGMQSEMASALWKLRSAV